MNSSVKKSKSPLGYCVFRFALIFVQLVLVHFNYLNRAGENDVQ